MTALATIPAALEQASIEDLTYGIDLTAPLAAFPAANPTAVACTLLFNAVTTIALADLPLVNGNVVNQRVRAGVLAQPGSYQLRVTFTPSGTTDILATVLFITRPF